MPARLSTLLTVAVTAALLLVGSGVASASGFWELASVQVNPDNASNPSKETNTYDSVSDGNLTRTARRIERGVVTGSVAFTTTWPTPPGTLSPGAPYRFLVTLSGKISGEDSGIHSHSAYLELGGKRITSAIETIKQGCFDPIGAAPLTCDPPVTETRPVEFTVPVSGDQFSFGIDGAGCGSYCTVRYTYVWKTVAPPPPPATAPATSAPAAGSGSFRCATGWLTDKLQENRKALAKERRLLARLLRAKKAKAQKKNLARLIQARKIARGQFNVARAAGNVQAAKAARARYVKLTKRIKRVNGQRKVIRSIQGNRAKIIAAHRKDCL